MVVTSYDGELNGQRLKPLYLMLIRTNVLLPLSVRERLELQAMYDGTGEHEGMDEQARKDLAEETFAPCSPT